MAGTSAAGESDAGTARRTEQVVIVVVCILSLVVAGAIAPTLGSPFEDGPAVNASSLVDANSPEAGGADGSVPQTGSDALSNVSQGLARQGIGSSDTSRVGSAESLAAFRNQSGAIQFVVESPRNTYYRVGAYESFDGYSWSRETETTSFSGAVPGATPRGSEITMRVTLNASATALPVPWKPAQVDGPVPLSVRETGGIVPRRTLSANQSFTVTAVETTRDPSVLAETTYFYPREIKETYLDVDDDIADRVVDLADEVTADADNPYAEAVAIEEYLESNKDYSLDARADPDRPVTEQFLFEMDAGYCQYFASSMAVMLRSQGIPARYVVGYAPGTKVGDSTYAITGSQAHAWVEVYFEDVGWVRFDPTPPADREAADDAVANQSTVEHSYEGSSLSDSVNGSDFEPSDGSTTDGDDGTTGEDGDGTDEDGQDGDGDSGDGDDDPSDGDDQTDDSTDDGSTNESTGLIVQLDGKPVPGSYVTVSVTRDGEPVVGASVYFNDRYVGRTNYRGEVRGKVPYVQNLSVRVESDEDASNSSLGGSGERPGAVGLLGGSGEFMAADSSASMPDDSIATMPARDSLAVPGDDGSTVRYDVDAGGTSRFDARPEFSPDDSSSDSSTTSPENETTREFTVSSEMSFTVAGRPIPGETVSMQVSIDGEAIPQATVTVDGERIGRTDDRGRIEVTLPADQGAVSVRAERGDIEDAATIELSTTVNVTVTQGLAIPGKSVGIRAMFEGEPIANGTVRVGERVVGTTTPAGWATVQVPRNASGTMTITVEHGVLSGDVKEDVLTNATIAFAEQPSPGTQTVLTVSVANKPVRDATVTVGGERQGTTNGEGEVVVLVPETATGSVNVSASAGSIEGHREVDLFEPNVSVTPAYLVTLPGAPVAVNVTDAGEPVQNASVFLGSTAAGTAVAETDEAGRAVVTLPVRNTVTVTATAVGATASTRLAWLYLHLFGVLLGVLGVGVVAVGSIRRRGRLGAVATRVRSLARRVGAVVVDALVGVSNWIDSMVGELPRVPGMIRSFLQGALAAPLATLRALSAGVLTRVLGVLLVVSVWLQTRLRGGTGSSDGESSDGGEQGAVAGADGTTDPLVVVRAAWRTLVRVVSPARVRTRTPGEISREALERGLPADAVQTLTETYRRAVYGGAEPSSDDVAAVASAKQTIEDAASARGDVQGDVHHDVQEHSPEGDGGKDGGTTAMRDGGTR